MPSSLSGFEIAVISSATGGVVGAAASWLTAFDAARRDRVRRRKALATVLLIELKSIERTARTAYEYHDHTLAGPNDSALFPAFALAPDTLAGALGPETVDLVMRMGSLAAQLRAAVLNQQSDDPNVRRHAPMLIAATAAVIATYVAPMKQALEREGGRYTRRPAPETPRMTEDGKLPALPPAAFPEDEKAGKAEGTMRPVPPPPPPRASVG